MTTENFMFSGNFNTCSEVTLRLPNKRRMYLYLPKTGSMSEDKTSGNYRPFDVLTIFKENNVQLCLASRCGFCYAIPQPDSSARNFWGHSVRRLDQKRFGLRDQ